MPSKQIQCANPTCSIVIQQRKPWHRFCSSVCRATVWKTNKLVQDMTDKVMKDAT